MDRSKLFRKAALDRLRSPEQLHTLMRVTDAKGWIALVGCAIILVTAIAWGFLGSVRTKVAARGILLGGDLVELGAQGDGDITSIDVDVGDVVKKGDVVARIAQTSLAPQIESLERRLEELDQDVDAGALTTLVDRRRDRIKSDIARLQAQLAEGGRVVSNAAGRVVELRASVGDHVVSGSPVLALELIEEGSDLEALLYFDANVGKALRPGMTVELTPSTVRKERHGVLFGRVTSVDHYPSTRRGMMGILRNEHLVESFIDAAGGAPIGVRAEILRDGSARSGYRWSSGDGPDVVLTSGTQCTGAVILRTQRPIALVFPALDDGG